MARFSPSQTCITIICEPELYEKFYHLRRRANQLLKTTHTNREFLDYLLRLFEERLAEEERKRVVKAY